MRAKLIVAGLSIAMLAAPGAFAQEGDPPPEAPAQGEANPAFEMPAEMEAVLAEKVDPGQLSDEELAAREKLLRRLAKTKDMPANVKKQITVLHRQSFSELQARKKTAAVKKKTEDAEKPKDEAAAEDGNPEQPKEPAPVVAEGLPAGFEEYLADRRDPTELTMPELSDRLKAGKGFARNKAIAGADRKRLIPVLNSVQREASRRKQVAQKEIDAKAAAEKAANPPPADTAETKAATPAAPAADPTAFLADARPAEELSDKDLKSRVKLGRVLLKDKSLDPGLRRKVIREVRAADLETNRRKKMPAGDKTQAEAPVPEVKPEVQPEKAETPKAEPAKPKTTAETEAPGKRFVTETDPEVAKAFEALMADTRKSGDLSDADLRQREIAGRTLLKPGQLTRTQYADVGVRYRADRLESIRRKQTAGSPDQPKKPVDKAEVEKLDGNKADPATEAKAKAFLGGSAKAEDLSDAELRKSVDGMRDLLTLNKLSAQTEKALRVKLAADRDVLRGRIDKREAENQTQAEKDAFEKAMANKTEAERETARAERDKRREQRRNRKNKFDFDITVVLGDRRPSAELDEEELQDRIEAYREANLDEAYDEDTRVYYRESLERDRRFLRERKIAERRARARRIAAERDSAEYNVDLDDEYSESEPQRRGSIFAAEADDAELEAQLAAAPRAPVKKRRIAVEEVAAKPELRESMPAIEIDTIRFGFNESVVREEELENLDRIGAVLEKILANNPGEVFLVEGHTDAVGSDGYNLPLSKKRAEAVKEALSTYYVIPAQNLKTAGYGERYLKIPTAEEEPENRRVGIRRVTPLVGELKG